MVRLQARLSVRCLFVGERVITASVEGDDVVDDVAAGVEVWESVIDSSAADAARWFVACDRFAVAVADGGVASGAHGWGGMSRIMGSAINLGSTSRNATFCSCSAFITAGPVMWSSRVIWS